MSSAKLLLSTQSKLLPWNFQATLMRQAVQNLESPVNNAKYFTKQAYCSLFKDFAESIQSNDYDTLTTLLEPRFRRQVSTQLESMNREMAENKMEMKIECNRKNVDESLLFLYNIENYFIVGADTQTLDRDIFNKEKSNYAEQKEEKFRIAYPHLNTVNEVEHLEKEISCTQIVNTSNFSQNSRGFLVMRLHFIVTSYLNMYIWDSEKKEAVMGHPLNMSQRTNADKKSHFMTVDKLVAEMHVGDTFLDSEDQMQDRVIRQFSRDEGLMISDFDNYMQGNPFLKSSGQKQ